MIYYDIFAIKILIIAEKNYYRVILGVPRPTQASCPYKISFLSKRNTHIPFVYITSYQFITETSYPACFPFPIVYKFSDQVGELYAR